MLWAEVGCVASDGNFSLCQLDTCKCVVLFFMYICKCSIMPFLYVLFVKILSYVEEIKNIYLANIPNYWPKYEMSALGKTDPNPVKSNPMKR